MRTTYVGGTAVLLPVRLPSHLAAVYAQFAGDWVPPGIVYSVPDYHITLQFVGRNLNSDVVLQVINAAWQTVGPLPVEFTGVVKQWSTTKGQYLVAEVERTRPLLDMRRDFRAKLHELGGPVIHDQFEYNPHVTIAEAPPSANVDTHAAFSTVPYCVNVVQADVKYGNRKLTMELV